jgi:sarcosine oxidase subunit alpha
MKRQVSFRLSSGGDVDRDQPLRFTCNGRALVGCAGDTLASALFANGVRVVGRSFKRHRPRGVMSAGVEETNALFRIDIGRLSRSLVRATLEPLTDGMIARTENAFPTVTFDLGRIVDFTILLWPAGFYNKTFKWPSWHWYEGLIRRAAGLGIVPDGIDPTRYYEHNLHCDVLVIGAGPAGLSAARAAGCSGVRVVLIEQDFKCGGRLLADRAQIDGAPAAQWIATVLAELQRAPNVRVFTRTTVVGYYDHNVLTAVERLVPDVADQPVERLWKIRAGQVVLATGAIEQPLVFTNNDRPGILLAGAVRQYIQRYAVTPGRAVIVATNNDDAYQTAFALQDAGVSVPAIVDCREVAASPVAGEARRRALTVLANTIVVDTKGTRGIREITVSELTKDGRGGAARCLRCDAVATSGGWSPTVHLYSQAGGRLRYDDLLACFVPEGGRPNLRVTGAANGEFALAQSLESGAGAGCTAARLMGAPVATAIETLHVDQPASYGVRRLARPLAGSAHHQWIDFLHDVTVSDIELAVRENFVAIEHVKRYTTAGMAADQGKTSNLNAILLLAELTNLDVKEIGTTTFRPLFTPVPLGAIAGGSTGIFHSPARHLPAHSCHAAHGARMTDYGSWKRPACYPTETEAQETTISREVLTVRGAVGLFDASPLGKIEIVGPDSAKFLHRVYVQDALSLRPGAVRYGVMLNENGVVMDDGVFASLASDHYLVNCTSGNADRVARWLDEWHRCEWPDLEIVIAPVTPQWAVLTLAGPRARDVLASLESDIDFSATSFPHMGIRCGHISGSPVRVQRVSYSGELTFEISVAAQCATWLWQLLVRNGTPFGIEPVGIEALLVLRLEKGFLHIGTDTDGTTNPMDIGLGRVIQRKSGDFVGRRSLLRPEDQRESRRQLVGIEPVNSSHRLRAGAHVVTSTEGKRRSEGFVTSACVSPTLKRPIGIGMLEAGMRRLGETVAVFDEGRLFPARVVSPVFYDPQGKRMNG